MSVTELNRTIDDLDWRELVLIVAACGLACLIWLLGLWKLLELEWSFLNFCWEILR